MPYWPSNLLSRRRADRSLVWSQGGEGRLFRKSTSMLVFDRSRINDVDLVGVFYGFFLFVALLLYLDPFYTGFGKFRVTRDIGFIKYTALFFGLGLSVFALAALRLRSTSFPQKMMNALRAGWPVYLLCLLILSGSIYARVELRVHEGFLPSGLSMLAFPLAIIIFFGSLQPETVVKRYLFGLLLCCLYVIPMIVTKRLQGGQAFHTEIFLVIPLMVYSMLAYAGSWFSWVSMIILAVTAFFLHKNLGYMNLLISVLYVLAVRYRRSRTDYYPLTKMFIAYLLFIITLAAIALSVYLFMHRDIYMPSGNVAVREEAYTYAINKFLSHPIVGDLYTGQSVIYITGQEVLGRGHVTTHSDWLDALSHGGVVGVSLLFLAVAIPMASCYKIIKSAPRSLSLDMMHSLFIIALGGVTVSFFVSMLNATQVATLFWLNLGLMVALAHSIDSRPNDGHLRPVL